MHILRHTLNGVLMRVGLVLVAAGVLDHPRVGGTCVMLL